jgi:hypothetical protein
MTDEVFSPYSAPRSVSVPGSAEVLYLRAALFVMRGTFHDPIAEEQRPLPPHRWVLVHSETVFSEGTTSDEDGISTIFTPSVPEDLPDDATWELWLIPIYPGRADSDAYAEQGEAWIDVEQRVWATAEAVKSGILSKVTERKLLRIPFWTSTRQATHGGFEGGPPGAAQWDETGVLTTSELLAFGTRDEPWSVAIDHGWMRTHVQLRYYDFATRQEKPIPQGVVLRAEDAHEDAYAGGSSVRLENGAIYVLHDRPPEASGELEYSFGASGSMFELDSGAIEAVDNFEPERLATHYLLPRLWSSRGMEAWTGGGDASADVRKPFAELRNQGQDPADPLCFHLDDAVLTDELNHLIETVQDRICILDSQLAIRDQASNGVGLVPWSERTLTSPLLRAEEYVFERGQGIERLSRVFECGGWVFALDLQRTTADSMRGARSAKRVTKSSLFADSPFAAQYVTVHLVDTRYLRHSVGTAKPKLAHLLVYQGFYLDMFDLTLGISEVEHGLFQAAQVWDQVHPAHTEHVGRPGSRKDYVVVARQRPLDDDATVIKLRHHFGLRNTPQRLPRVKESDVNDDEHANSHIILRATGRANMGKKMKLYLTSPNETEPRTAAPFAFGPEKAFPQDRIDDVKEPFFTLAHELGHAIGLPDEYRELWSPDESELPRMPRFDQGERKPQFALDHVAAMAETPIPRLRYVWPFVRGLGETSQGLPEDHWLRAMLPCEVLYEPPGRVLRYTLPDDVDLWEPVHRDDRATCTLELYALGDDESARGPMFVDPPHIFDTLFDGVVVVTCKLWFDFEPSFPDKLAKRWNLIWNRIGETYEKRAKVPRFFVEAPASATEFRRVPILVVPHVQFGPAPSVPRSESRRHLEELSAAHVRVVVFGKSKAAPTKDLTTTPPSLRVHRSALGHGVLRFALDPANQPTGDLEAALSAVDFEPVNRWLSTTLGRALGTLRPYP